jgi:glycerol-3-phosphate dehydrogenase
MSTQPDIDILIIGGGIHGAGIAQAAAAHGFNTVLLEQTALGFGTSSRSSKLIHGGLRYLKTGHFGLVRESIQERQLLLKLAPDLVHLLQFHIPIYKHTTVRPYELYAGLFLYAAFAGATQAALFHTLASDEWDQLGGLRTEGLQKVFCYWDAQTDDRLLTQAVVQSAQSMGAEVKCPAQFMSAEREGDNYRVQVLENAGGTHERQTSLRCRFLVNTAGPWANRVLENIRPAPTRLAMDLVQGSHILLPDEISDKAFYLEAPQDQRAVFIMPWYGKTLVGTTEVLYKGDPAKVEPLPQEIDYLLETYSTHFPGRDLEILDQFAGLRVLPSRKGKLFNRPRETIFHLNPAKDPRLLTVYGGKLTGYRATSAKLIKKIEKQIGKREEIADTAELPLSAPVTE